MRYAFALALSLASSAGAQNLRVQDVPVGIQPASIATGDLDGDGDLDLVVVNRQVIQRPPLPPDISVLLNDGTGAFAEAGRYASPGQTAVVAADFDGDGDADVAVTSFDGVAVHISTDGALSPPTFYPTAGEGEFAFARGLVAADLTGDGVVDLAVANDNANTVSLFAGVGDGTFGPRRDITGFFGGPTGIDAADLDGDGDTDLAVVASGSGDLYVLLNPGDGAFAAPTASGSAGPNPLSVVAADLDGDGDLDLGVADLFGAIYTRAGTGSGAFAPRVQIAVASSNPNGSALYAVAAADFDGDGRADLAAAQGSDADLALAFGGQGTVTKVPVGTGPQGVVAADLDGDGDADLASADTDANTVTVRLNAGGGTFLVASETRARAPVVSVSVWPNPVRSLASVSITGRVSERVEVVEVVVFDVLGRTVDRFEVLAGLGDASWDASGVSAGIYVVRARGSGWRADRVVTVAR